MTEQPSIEGMARNLVGGQGITAVFLWSKNPMGETQARQFNSVQKAVEFGGGEIELFTTDGGSWIVPPDVHQQMRALWIAEQQTRWAVSRSSTDDTTSRTHSIWVRDPHGDWHRDWFPDSETYARRRAQADYGALGADRVKVLPVEEQP